MPTPSFHPESLPGSFSFTPRSYRLDTPAWLAHLPFAYDLVAWLKPQSLVELGSHYGNSYFTMCQSARENKAGTTCYAVDTWRGDDHAELYAEEVFAFVRKHNEEHYRDFSYLLRMTFDEALGHFGDGSVDLLHIDGFHTYEAVRHDFETWLPKVREGGILLFHDVLVREKDFGVWKFWEELQRRYPTFTFHQGHGLGVLANTRDLQKISEPVRRFFTATPAEAEALRSYYAQCALRLTGLFAPPDLDRKLRENREEYRKLAVGLQAQLARIPALEREARWAARMEAEVRKLKSSRSWKLSAPVRDVERLWEKVRGSAPAGASEYVFRLDQPANLEAAPIFGLISGWLYSALGTPILGVRARGARQTWAGRAQLPRADVALDQISAGPASGFEIPYRLPKHGKFTLALEVLHPNGQWIKFHHLKLRAVDDSAPQNSVDYARWIEADAAANPPLPPPAGGPFISIVMPVYNPPEKCLRRALDSVCAQTYTRWELCVADDASTEPHVRAVLDAYAAKEPRIKVVYRPKNGHISAASNSALELATGEFTGFLDHDDELEPHALAEVARAIGQNPSAQAFYSDEDKIDQDGRRFDHFFKPDWMPDRLLGQNYLCHLTVYRTARVREVGGFRLGYEGSQDWDLALRITERLQPAQIVHIPRILYHWRAVPGSTAHKISAKNYAVDSAHKALSDHLQRTKRKANLAAVKGGHWRVRFSLPGDPPLVSIIIPTKNGEALVRRCLDTLRTETTYPNYEIILVDNRSDDPGALAYFQQLPTDGVTVLEYDAPFNYSAINNFAVACCQGQVLAFLNNDLEIIHGDWLSEMVSHALRPEIGAVGAMLYYPDDRIQHAGVILGLGDHRRGPCVAGHAMKCFPRGKGGYGNALRLVQNYSAVTGACLVLRRDVFQQVGGFDEKNLPIAFNDVDLCLRVRAAGYRNVWTPFAELYHHESASRGPEDTPEKQARFAREIKYMRDQWAEILDHDPAYNPNLTLDHENFNLAWPPNVLAQKSDAPPASLPK